MNKKSKAVITILIIIAGYALINQPSNIELILRDKYIRQGYSETEANKKAKEDENRLIKGARRFRERSEKEQKLEEKTFYNKGLLLKRGLTEEEVQFILSHLTKEGLKDHLIEKHDHIENNCVNETKNLCPLYRKYDFTIKEDQFMCLHKRHMDLSDSCKNVIAETISPSFKISGIELPKGTKIFYSHEYPDRAITAITSKNFTTHSLPILKGPVYISSSREKITATISDNTNFKGFSLKAGTKIVFNEHNIFEVILFEDQVIGGLPLKSGLVSFDDNKVSEGVLSKDHSVEGFPLKENTKISFRKGQFHRGTLSRNHSVNEILLKAGHLIVVTDERLSKGTLAEDYTTSLHSDEIPQSDDTHIMLIQNHNGKPLPNLSLKEATFKAGTEIRFNTKEAHHVCEGTLTKNHTILGIPIKKNKPVKLCLDGSHAGLEGYLAENKKIGGRTYLKNTKIKFFKGTDKILCGTLAEDVTVKQRIANDFNVKDHTFTKGTVIAFDNPESDQFYEDRLPPDMGCRDLSNQKYRTLEGQRHIDRSNFSRAQ